MKRVDLDIYREYYQKSPLADIWDKISNALEDHGVEKIVAEYASLRITEWIRTTWGGLILVERHGGDPREHSRFDLLRDHALIVLAEVVPEMVNHGVATAEIVRVVRVDYKGKYITRCKKLDQLQRDIDIFNRGNTAAQMEQLAIKNNISVIRVYQVNAALVKSKDKREQQLLPFG
jgi:Mor family transcriptional regulator